MQTTAKSERLYQFLIFLAVLMNLSGLFTTIQGPDAALYGSIAKTMVVRNNYIDLFVNGKDWLDKPHFPFWVTALFFKCFGIHTWTYKLPGILFLMMGAGYTYLFGKRLYNKSAGLLSVLILLTAEHTVLSNSDVRAEPFLTGLIMAATYHFYRSIGNRNWMHLIVGCVFGSCAIMTKGLFALIPVAGAIGGHLLITRNWRELFNIRWLAASVLMLIFIAPELWCLYLQFDKHPEKLVFNQHGVSGLKFFFWDSQFGRFFNTGPIKGEGDPFFFFHTLLWAFLPWSLLLYTSVIVFFKDIRRTVKKEWYCICGSLLTFFVFSVSKFQLPYYLNIIFPFFAIVLAAYLMQVSSQQTISNIIITQGVLIALLFAGVIVVHILFQPDHTVTVIVLVILLALLLAVKNKWTTGKLSTILFYSVVASLFINFYMNLVFYPTLLKYQSGSEAAFYLNKKEPGTDSVVTVVPSYPLVFYLNRPLITSDTSTLIYRKGAIIYIPELQLDKIRHNNWNYTVLDTFAHFPITQMDMSFVNHTTRNKSLQKVYLIRLQ